VTWLLKALHDGEILDQIDAVVAPGNDIGDDGHGHKPPEILSAQQLYDLVVAFEVALSDDSFADAPWAIAPQPDQRPNCTHRVAAQRRRIVDPALVAKLEMRYREGVSTGGCVLLTPGPEQATCSVEHRLIVVAQRVSSSR